MMYGTNLNMTSSIVTANISSFRKGIVKFISISESLVSATPTMTNIGIERTIPAAANLYNFSADSPPPWRVPVKTIFKNSFN